MLGKPFDTHKLHDDFQPNYHTDHSMKTVHLKVHHDTPDAALIPLDLATTFGINVHRILQMHLEYANGMTGRPLSSMMQQERALQKVSA